MDDETRKLIAETAISEAVGFYKLIVATATLFLGGTLVFWEKLSPPSSAVSLFPLAAGWLCLILSVAFVVAVRRDNVELGRLCLTGTDAKYDRIAARSRSLTTLSGMFLAVGMLFVASAGMVTLWEKTMASENKRVEGPNESKSIPFKEIAGNDGTAGTGACLLGRPAP